jgi:hypothetical protein
MSREKSLGLWKYNKRSGIWDHQRGVTPETKDQWLGIHKKDEPDAHFHVGSNKPKHNPTLKEVEGGGLSGAPVVSLGGGSEDPNKKNLYITKKPMEEDAPTNSIGAGNIEGAGVGPKGEPGRLPGKKLKNQDPLMSSDVLRRKTPLSESEEKRFAGHRVFEVKSDIFHKARLEKRKGAHWKKYLSADDEHQVIHEYARKNPRKAIILQDSNSGAMMYARYGKSK